MDIDKRTGRGCAWSIVSKTIARKLVDDGIVGKEIAEKLHLQVRFHPDCRSWARSRECLCNAVGE